MKLFCVFFTLIFAFVPNFNKTDCKKMDIVQKDIAICIQNFDKISEEYQEKFFMLKYPLTFVVSKDYNNKYYKKDKEVATSLVVNRKYHTIIADGNLSELKNTLIMSLNSLQLTNTCVVLFDAQTLNEKNIYICLSEVLFELYEKGAVLKLYQDLK